MICMHVGVNVLTGVEVTAVKTLQQQKKSESTAWTDHESALREEMVGGLSDVSGMYEVVIRVAELAVALFKTRKKVV